MHITPEAFARTPMPHQAAVPILALQPVPVALHFIPAVVTGNEAHPVETRGPPGTGSPLAAPSLRGPPAA